MTVGKHILLIGYGAGGYYFKISTFLYIHFQIRMLRKKEVLHYHFLLTLLQDMRLGIFKKGRQTELEWSSSASGLG